MKLKLSWKTFLYSALMTFLFAALGGIVTYLGMPFFEQVKQPPLSPPAFLFPIVWSILFLAMSLGAAIIYDSDNPNAPKALLVYLVQLTMNFWWCVFFFGFRMYLFSFIWLLLLMIAVVVMIILFTRINRLAGFIQLGYL
ncbi:MAG: tryptophan-rich sensory protein, partial [Clostridia bacterium]|nr:tryptophan-rich sensory protein [Clostridia bacterium]